jgi:hypothetical protein
VGDTWTPVYNVTDRWLELPCTMSQIDDLNSRVQCHRSMTRLIGFLSVWVRRFSVFGCLEVSFQPFSFLRTAITRFRSKGYAENRTVEWLFQLERDFSTVTKICIYRPISSDLDIHASAWLNDGQGCQATQFPDVEFIFWAFTEFTFGIKGQRT